MPGKFETTSWSMVLSAANTGSEASRAALEALCRAYWWPLYAHIRGWGHSPEDAKDLTQEFFARLLEYGSLAAVDPTRGRFRTFLLASLDHFLAEQRRRARTQRHGGAGVPLSLDFVGAEERLRLLANPDLDPRRQYDRHWAQSLLETVMARLEREFAKEGRAFLFEELRPCLLSSREVLPYRVLGERVGLSEGALKVTIHRLRRRYALLLRDEVARTVEDATAVDEELRYLIEVMGTPAGTAV